MSPLLAYKQIFMTKPLPVFREAGVNDAPIFNETSLLQNIVLVQQWEPMLIYLVWTKHRTN